MSCYIREMTTEDLKVVGEIDREAFPTQWPAPNYGNEMRNRSAHFVVACDEGKPLPTTLPETVPPNKPGFLSSLLGRLFRRGKTAQDTLSSTGSSGKARGNHYIVGFVGLWIMADEAHITSIAVRESYRRRGIGELLLISAIEKAIEVKAEMLTLEVRVSNTPAQGLYTKYGFIQVGLRKAYYTDNREDAFIMSTDRIASPSFQSRFQELKQAYASRVQSSNIKGQN